MGSTVEYHRESKSNVLHLPCEELARLAVFVSAMMASLVFYQYTSKEKYEP